MGRHQIHHFPNPTTLATHVATQWLEQLKQSQPGAPFHVALSGGRITRQLLASIVDQSRERQIDLGHVHFFWADERCVPPTDPESNFACAQELLFEPLAICADHIHRIRGEVDPDRASIEAAAEMERTVPRGPGGQPQLDLVFLGMGEDGHVASLFPDEPEAMVSSKSIYRPVTAPKPPPNRITLNYGTLAAAHKVWVVISGSGKEQALANSTKPDGQTPLARVLRLRQHTDIFSDVQFPGTAGIPAGEIQIIP